MGRSTTPLYSTEVDANVSMDFFGWNVKAYGKPTEANLEKMRTGYNQSFQPGGCNFHNIRGNNIVPHISAVRVRYNKGQRRGELVAEAKGPMFEVV